MPEILVSLVGEQPIPSLMAERTLLPESTVLVCTERTRAVAERLGPLVNGSLLQLPDAFRIDRITEALRRQIGDAISSAAFDVTSGTKPMALAAYGLAASATRPAIYVRTTGLQPAVSVYDAGTSRLTDTHTVARDAFTLDEYLRAHLSGYREMGPATDDDGTLNIGGRFELEVASALRTCCDEVMVGVKPAGLGQQVDLDLVVRRGPRVGVVECKLARSGAAEKPKQGLDQLMQATDRVAFGSHAVRMLVTGAPMNASLQRLAANRRVKCTWARYRDGHPLDEMEVRRIQQATREAFDTV